MPDHSERTTSTSSSAAGMETPDNWPSCAVGPEPDLPLPEKRRPVEVKPVPTSAATTAVEYITVRRDLVQRVANLAKGAVCLCWQSAGAMTDANGTTTHILSDRHECQRCKALRELREAVDGQ